MLSAHNSGFNHLRKQVSSFSWDGLSIFYDFDLNKHREIWAKGNEFLNWVLISVALFLWVWWKGNVHCLICSLSWMNMSKKCLHLSEKVSSRSWKYLTKASNDKDRNRNIQRFIELWRRCLYNTEMLNSLNAILLQCYIWWVLEDSNLLGAESWSWLTKRDGLYLAAVLCYDRAPQII